MFIVTIIFVLRKRTLYFKRMKTYASKETLHNSYLCEEHIL